MAAKTVGYHTSSESMKATIPRAPCSSQGYVRLRPRVWLIENLMRDVKLQYVPCAVIEAVINNNSSRCGYLCEENALLLEPPARSIVKQAR